MPAHPVHARVALLGRRQGRLSVMRMRHAVQLPLPFLCVLFGFQPAAAQVAIRRRCFDIRGDSAQVSPVNSAIGSANSSHVERLARPSVPQNAKNGASADDGDPGCGGESGDGICQYCRQQDRQCRDQQHAPIGENVCPVEQVIHERLQKCVAECSAT